MELQNAVAGRYSIEREIGRGGMAIVYLARDIALDRLVAIKLLKPDLAIQEQFRTRFRREARIAAKLSHPNIVPIYLVEERGDLIYFVMSYVAGETIAEIVRRSGPLPLEDTMRWLHEIAWALGYAHAHGVTHRDIKPENVLIERGTGRAVVTDFGIACTGKGAGTTAGGEVVGTPHFVSPEQALGEPVDARSDIYSLGATAYFMLTGRLVFDAPTDQQIVSMHITRRPEPIAALRPGVPWALTRIVERCLQKAPEDRFASGDKLALQLEDLERSQLQIPKEVSEFHLTTAISGERLAILLPASIMLLLTLLFSRESSVVQLLVLWVTWIVLAELIRQPVRVLRSARRVLQAGISYGELRELSRVSVSETVDTRARSSETSARPLVDRGLDLAALAVPLIVTLLAAPSLPASWLQLSGPGLWGTLVAVVLLALAVFSLWGAAQGGAWLRRTIQSHSLGAWCFTLAGVGLKPPAGTKLPSPDAAEIVLGGAAVAVMEDMTETKRHQLALVPRILAELEERVNLLRAQRGEIDRAMMEVRDTSHPILTDRDDQPVDSDPLVSRKRATRNELLEARRRISKHLADVMARMEMIRLELIRIRAGTGSVTELLDTLEHALPDLSSLTARPDALDSKTINHQQTKEHVPDVR